MEIKGNVNNILNNSKKKLLAGKPKPFLEDFPLWCGVSVNLTWKNNLFLTFKEL